MPEPKLGGDVKAALWTILTLVLVGVAIGGTGIAVALTPIVFLLVLYCMFRVPIRRSMMALMFLSFTLENPSEGPGCGMWSSPFRGLGGIFLNHMNALDRDVGYLSPLAFSLQELLIFCLLLIAWFRRASGSKIDAPGRLATPKPLVQLAQISLAGTAFVLLTGLARGGVFRFALWQVSAVMYLPLLFMLFHVGLRGPKDHLALAKVVIWAAVLRASLAIYIQSSFQLPEPDPISGSTKLPYATTHNDTMLFAGGFVLLFSMLFERAGKKATRTALLLLPILVYGMISNNRRMVWVQVAIVMLTVYLIAPDNVWKRRIRMSLYSASPVALLYLAIGWGKTGGAIWKPAILVRSVVDAKSDGSSFWRVLENFDLISTVRNNPLLGAGYGNPYEEIITLPAIPYELERYLPHNSILGLWAYCGYIGFTATTLLWAGGIYFAMRAYHRTRDAKLRVAAIGSFGGVLIYLVQCWGDMGLASWTGVYLVAPGLAVAGKLAVATGAWGTKQSGPARAPMGSTPGVPEAEQAA